jgi:hypothetical protein
MITRTFFAGLVFTAAIGFPSRAAGSVPQDQHYVRASVTLSRDSIEAGSTCGILVTFVPEDGIHVNVDPAPEIRLDSVTSAHLAGSPMLSTTSRGFLNPDSPVDFAIQVDPDAPEGTKNLKGVCTYYYCSDAEKWCVRARQPFELKLQVEKPTR